jgi:hypothetical protein
VALSADGNTAIVGGPENSSNVGAAWVWTRSGSTWSQQQMLAANNATGAALQGTSVALSADGITAIVGGPHNDANVGAAFVFSQSGGVWTEQNQLVGSGPFGQALQGYAVALSGENAILGGCGDDAGTGAVWVFSERPRIALSSGESGLWTQQGWKLDGYGAIGFPSQGQSVALSTDGSTMIVGGYTDNSSAGAAWVFVPADFRVPTPLAPR